MALLFEPGNGGGVIDTFAQEQEAARLRGEEAGRLMVAIRRAQEEIIDLFTFEQAREPVFDGREFLTTVPTPTPSPPTPAPTPTPIVMNLIAEPGPETRVRQTLQSLLAPILAGGGFGGGTGRALPLGTAGTRLVAAPPARSPLVTLLILAGIAGVGYYLYQRYRKGKAT